MELFKDKVVLIAGVGPGLGRHLALGAAREGADVGICARSADFLEELAEDIRSLGRRAVAVPTDITDIDQCANFIDSCVEQLGGADALINTAMVHTPGLFEDSDLGEWKKVVEAGCFGYLNLCQKVVPYFKQRGGGAIVNVNSLGAKEPEIGGGAYFIGKGAVSTATRVMAKELGGYNIRVNQAYMGFMWGTPLKGMFAQLAKDENTTVEALRAGIEAQLALPQMATDEECSHTVLFLASDYARVVTGASIDVNAGHLFGP